MAHRVDCKEEARLGKDEPGAALGRESHNCCEDPSGLPTGMNPLLTISLL